MITNLERVIKREQDQKYNEGRTEGREELLHILWQMTKKKFPNIDNKYFEKI